MTHKRGMIVDNVQNNISVGVSNNLVFIKVEGKGTFQISQPLRQLSLEMIGRTDSTGTDMQNRALSSQRVAASRDALTRLGMASAELAEIATRLERMPKIQQERLINWGFAIADAAMRLYVDTKLTRPATLPYPTAGIG